MKSIVFFINLVFVSASVFGMSVAPNSLEINLQKELWKAISKKNLNIKKLVKTIKHEVNINCRNSHGDTPFLYAVRTHKLSLLKILIQIPKVNINSLDSQGNTSLIIAAKHKNTDVVKLLINHVQFNVHDVLTFLNAYKNKQKWSNEQIQWIINQKIKSFLNAQNNKGNTALITAVSCGNYELTEYLTEHYADINIPNVLGRTPLAVAVMHRKEQLIKYLVTHGADINKTDVFGYSPLSIAIEKPNKKLIKYLVDHGADVNSQKEEIESPISFAIRNNNRKLIKYMISHGANINPIELGDLFQKNFLFKHKIDWNQIIQEFSKIQLFSS